MGMYLMTVEQKKIKRMSELSQPLYNSRAIWGILSRQPNSAKFPSQQHPDNLCLLAQACARIEKQAFAACLEDIRVLCLFANFLNICPEAVIVGRKYLLLKSTLVQISQFLVQLCQEKVGQLFNIFSIQYTLLGENPTSYTFP